MVGSNGIRTSAVIFAVFLICVGIALWAASGEDIWAEVFALGAGQVAILLLLSLVNYTLRARRWQLFGRKIGAGLPAATALRHYIGGFALTMTPARIGEWVRLRWISRETGAPLETLAPLVLLDRAGDLAAGGLLLALALAFGTAGIAGGLPVAMLAIVVALIATRPALFATMTDAAFRLIRLKPRWFVRMRRAARALGPFSTASLIIPALGLGGLGWFAEGYAFYLLLGWMGADLPLWTCVAIFLFSMMTGGATGAPGGVGGAEAAMLALLSLQGVPLEISIPATAIIRITTLWFAIGLGALVFPFAEGMAKRKHHALE
ncbi:MAG: flippase-like domain-containing protein [Rhodobacteraceae bacterium]|nr:flippase-like domain-containing protein [Paracoccaceae bacterium]